MVFVVQCNAASCRVVYFLATSFDIGQVKCALALWQQIYATLNLEQQMTQAAPAPVDHCDKKEVSPLWQHLSKGMCFVPYLACVVTTPVLLQRSESPNALRFTDRGAVVSLVLSAASLCQLVVTMVALASILCWHAWEAKATCKRTVLPLLPKRSEVVRFILSDFLGVCADYLRLFAIVHIGAVTVKVLAQVEILVQACVEVLFRGQRYSSQNVSSFINLLAICAAYMLAKSAKHSEFDTTAISIVSMFLVLRCTSASLTKIIFSGSDGHWMILSMAGATFKFLYAGIALLLWLHFSGSPQTDLLRSMDRWIVAAIPMMGIRMLMAEMVVKVLSPVAKTLAKSVAIPIMALIAWALSADEPQALQMFQLIALMCAVFSCGTLPRPVPEKPVSAATYAQLQ